MRTASERLSPTAQKIYDKAYCDFLEQGIDPFEAADKADMVLLEWSQPLPLPAAPAGSWLCEDM